MLFGGSGIHEILKCLSKANLVIPLSIFLLEKTDVQSIFFSSLFGACQLVIVIHVRRKINFICGLQ